ncbi:Conserved DNA-binding protein YbaB [Amycolatopsis arida]|uniref:Conserved DNA-binding protein YbaB n=1 Tax=Amycolatopsis arida TaxID=587909 RepID=A0A1I5WRK8_9PSEU|nr:YbaB/EbfC family nucleoid-associated protein [Amycolatopsis arida]TDX92416.1 DNA-binding protein YbaB [Amycolatopsis arida]SFQ22403.1 Conserved DNA-binding protein YbaB [Amycolatopsis arida]
MTSPEQVEALKARLHKIKENPRQALFSEFRGTSRSGAVTVWVDLLGRQKRVHIAPNTVREGDEQWLTEEINSAYESAREAATFLDFDVAELARELRDAAAVAQRPPAPPAPDPSAARPAEPPTPATPPPPGPPPAAPRPERRRPPDDDEFFDGFNVRR